MSRTRIVLGSSSNAWTKKEKKKRDNHEWERKNPEEESGSEVAFNHFFDRLQCKEERGWRDNAGR